MIDYHGDIDSRDNYNLKDSLLNEYVDYIKKEESKKMVGGNNPNYGNKWSDEQKENNLRNDVNTY